MRNNIENLFYSYYYYGMNTNNNSSSTPKKYKVSKECIEWVKNIHKCIETCHTQEECYQKCNFYLVCKNNSTVGGTVRRNN